MSEDKITTLPYSAGQKQAILDLLDSKPFKSQIWEWQFLENPAAGEFDPVILVDKWETIIGFNGVMPVRIKHDNEIIRGLWSCDFFVDSRYQGRGYGKIIKQALHKRSPLIMALGISDMAAPVLLRMGWRKNNIVDSFRKLNRIPDVKSALLAGLQLLNRILRKKAPADATGCKVVTATALPAPDQVNRLWDSIAGEYTNIIVRDYPYLHWRYQQHPLAAYQFISAWQQDELHAMIVARITDTAAHLVDYIGPARNYAVKAQLLEKLLSITKGSHSLNCSTSDKEWNRVLLDYGFYKQPGKLRFYIYSAPHIQPESYADWFIMGGDSDGDLLKAGEEGPYKAQYPRRQIPQSRIRITQLTEAEFLAAETVWNTLIRESDANPLFLGWTWQSLWWRQWARKHKFRLYLLAAYADDNTLLGLAPLYKTEKTLHPGYHFTQLQFIGSSWGGKETVRTEYLDFIVSRQHAHTLRQCFLDYLHRDYSWDQLVISDLDRRSLTGKLLTKDNYFNKDYTRVVHTDMGIAIDVTRSFSDYLSRLGRNTRYVAYNNRKILQKLGAVNFSYADRDAAESCLHHLNTLHATRWNNPCFPPESLEFHVQLARAYAGAGKLRLSTLTVSGKPVSVLYNLIEDGREYNIQAGFDTNLGNKLSPGFLHLGYAIEDAFANNEIEKFDLLAGPGKNTFYKSRFGSRKTEFISSQINRAQYVKTLYKLYDLLPNFMKSIVSLRVFRE